MNDLADDALSAYLAGVASADGTRRVKDAVRAGHLDDWLEDRFHPAWIHVIAIGKAAAPMLWGLVEANVPIRGIGIIPTGSKAPIIDTIEWHQGDHPVPGDGSLQAGAALMAHVERIPPGAPVLVLLSGGASSLVEAWLDGIDGEDAVAAWRSDLAAGLPIQELNAARAARSALKGGRLADLVLARTDRLQAWFLSDVPADAPEQWVGSGPVWKGPEGPAHRLLAGTDEAVAAAGAGLAASGWMVYTLGRRLNGFVADEVDAFLGALADLPPPPEGNARGVALVAGGEPTLRIPPGASKGGRAQHAALLAARRIAETESVFFAAGTDGIDGTTPEAGAWVDGATAAFTAASGLTAEAALDAFDAHGFLDAAGRTVRTGPSATNVNDLWIGLRPR